MASEHDRTRLRCVAQALIASVGADGPMDAEDAAERACARIAELEAARDAAFAEIIRLIDSFPDYAPMPFDDADEHPDGYDGPCDCNTCRQYGAHDGGSTDDE